MAVIGRQPGVGRVAGPTIVAIRAVVMIVLRMTSIAIGWSALVNIVGMTTRTGSLNMCAGQFEGSLTVMVEAGRQPAAGFVACSAVGPKLTVMMIVDLMTGVTTAGGAIKHIIYMAGVTSQLNMFTGQFKGCLIVVEG
jgi:hypothetical protein